MLYYWGKSGAGTWRQEQKQKTWRHCLLAFPPWLVYPSFLYSSKPPVQWAGHLPYQSLNKEIPSDFPTSQSDGGNTAVAILFSQICLGLCQVNKSNGRLCSWGRGRTTVTSSDGVTWAGVRHFKVRSDLLAQTPHLNKISGVIHNRSSRSSMLNCGLLCISTMLGSRHHKCEI